MKLSTYTLIANGNILGNVRLTVTDVNDFSMSSTGTTRDMLVSQLDARYLVWFNIESFGAQSAPFDSTTAIQAAQAAAVAAGGGTVYFPPGTWEFGTITISSAPSSTTNPIQSQVNFAFSGVGATILTPNAANTPLFAISTAGFGVAEGVRFTGGFTVKAHSAGSTGPAINLSGARQFVIESPSYLDSLQGAAGTPGTYAQVIGFGVNTYACRIVNPVCEQQRLGACFVGSINSTLCVTNANVIENPLFEDNTAPYMIDAAGTLALSVIDGIIEGNVTTAAIRLGKHTIVSHCYFEQGTAAGKTFAMNGPGVDGYYPPGLPGSDAPYDPGGCLIEMCEFWSNPDVFTIPSGVTPGTMIVGPLNFLTVVDNTQSLLLNFQPAAATTLLNNASGGTNGTAVTTGNSGGVSGNAFSSVNGAPTFSSSTTFPPSALSYSFTTAASTAALAWNLPSSITPGQTIFTRTYVNFPTAVFNTTIISTSGVWYSVSSNGTNFTVRAVPGATVTTSVAIQPNTTYRLEMEVSFGTGTAVLNIYDQYGTLLGTATATGGTNTSSTLVYFGPISSSSGTSTGTMRLGNFGLTNGDWLGSAVASPPPNPVISTPALVNGTAALLSDTARDYMVYLQVGTAGTAFTLAIGPTSTPANVIMSSAVVASGQLLSFRLPGWYVKWSATTATLASQLAVGC